MLGVLVGRMGESVVGRAPCRAGESTAVMHWFLFQYERVPPTTWVYLSSLFTIAVYFKFSRLWSVRNLDLIGLILLAPGLLMVEYGRSMAVAGIEQLGFVWLFATAALFLIRLLLDPMMVRRPLLEPNMSVGGLTFVGVSLLLFLMANVLTSSLSEDDLAGSKQVEQITTHREVQVEANLASHGPGFPPLFWLPHLLTQKIYGSADAVAGQLPMVRAAIDRKKVHVATTKTVAVLSHLAIIIGMVVIGFQHFDNIKTGIAVATLYLLLPYTAQYTAHVDHVLPPALLVWAIVTYRRPMVAGCFMGLAMGVGYYPAFLLPLWFGFYWQLGLWRFAAGVLLAVAVLTGILAVMTGFQLEVLLPYLRQMFGLRWPIMADLRGFWQFEGVDPFLRIPILAAFVVLCISFAIWPAQKNLGTLISCSAVGMLAAQFWHAYGGGLYVAWYLPLLLMTVFRPNLEDRVALSTLGKGWLPRRRAPGHGVEQAA
ncbi:MAG: hypothetical protein A2W31_17135 [Planctomycetes bacterium RBG_16_64_10]|nr:MAG: hypothetical protein A2W31_17135 [Planctomycetes bacterium RBG_16_64_10]